MNGITRRESLATLAAGAALSAAATEGFVDAHVHVWTPDTAKYPLAPGFRKEDMTFPSFTAEELLSHALPTGVRRINLVQMTWYGMDHSYILDLIKQKPERFVGTGIVPAVTDATLAEPDRTMVELSKGRIFAFRVRGKSTRPPINDGPQWMDHAGYDKMFAAAAKHNLAISFLMSPPDLPEVDRMCAKFPDAPVIIDHLCLIGRKGEFPEDEVAAFCGLARHKRVMVKVGAFYALGARKAPHLEMLPLIRRVVTAYGPERCMWETDSPFQTRPPHKYGTSLALIREHADFLSASDKEQVLIRTAEKFFFKR